MIEDYLRKIAAECYLQSPHYPNFMNEVCGDAPSLWTVETYGKECFNEGLSAGRVKLAQELLELMVCNDG